MKELQGVGRLIFEARFFVFFFMFIDFFVFFHFLVSNPPVFSPAHAKPDTFRSTTAVKTSAPTSVKTAEVVPSQTLQLVIAAPTPDTPVTNAKIQFAITKPAMQTPT